MKRRAKSNASGVKAVSVHPVSFFHRSFERVSSGARAGLKRLPTFGGVRTILLVAFTLLLGAVIYLAAMSRAAIVAYDLRVKEARIEALEQENAQLRYDISALASPVRIASRARQLGLGPPTRVVYADLPALVGDKDLDVAVLPVRAPDVPLQSAAEKPGGWGQLLTLFGFGGTNRAEAQSR